MRTSLIPSRVPANQTQSRSPLGSSSRLAAWFSLPARGMKASTRCPSDGGWKSRPPVTNAFRFSTPWLFIVPFSLLLICRLPPVQGPAQDRFRQRYGLRWLQI